MYNSFIVGRYSPFIQPDFLNTKGWRSTMKSWSYTPAKQNLEVCFSAGDFAPSRSPFVDLPKAQYANQSILRLADGYPTVSTWDLWYNVLSNQFTKFNKTDTFAVLYNIEVALMLIEDFGITPSQITLVSDNDNKSVTARTLGCNVVDNFEDLTMNFTHVLKNPPWEDGIYAKFWEKTYNVLLDDGYQIDILPTNWMSLRDFDKYRKYLLENFQILSMKIYDNRKKEVFQIFNQTVIVMVSKKCKNPNNTLVEYTFCDQPTFTVDLTRYDFFPIYFSPLSVSILDKVLGKKTQNAVYDKNATANYISGQTMAQTMFVTNRNSWKLNNDPAVEDFWKLTYPGQSADLHFEWYQSDSFEYVLGMIKSQPKNQYYLIETTGVHNFTNNDFNSYFGFTQAHLDEIARWKSSK